MEIRKVKKLIRKMKFNNFWVCNDKNRTWGKKIITTGKISGKREDHGQFNVMAQQNATKLC